MFTKRYLKTFDFTFVILIIILVTIGIVAIGSALQINLGTEAVEPDKQRLFFLVGLLLMIMAVIIDYNFIGKFYIFLYIINLLLLILVFKIGKTTNGSTRWINLGFFSLQPSEFAKIIMIIFMAKLLDKNKQRINNIFVLIFIIILALIPTLLIQKQPSLSASLVIVAILLIQLFVAKINYKYIFVAGLLGIIAIIFLFWDIQQDSSFLLNANILNNYQVKRILAILYPEKDPDTYYQTMKSIGAIGSGQLYGKGLYKGTQNQLSYLPFSHTDFIFSVIGEEFGFVGCIVVVSLLFLVVIKCIIIAAKADDFYGRLIASGVAGMILFQTVMHVLITTGAMFNTGMPLPFISYGGSSLWTNMISIGLVINVGMKRVKTLF